MNNVPVRSCQTSWWLVLLLLSVGPWRVVAARGAPPAPSPAASPSPAPWQEELTNIRVVQASFLLTPAKDAAEDEARQARLADAYRQLAVKYPDASPVQMAVGDGLAQLESDDADAIPYWQRAANLDPKNAEAADALGGVFLRANRIPESYAQFQRAVDLRPDVAGYHSSLANVIYLFRKQLVPTPALPDDQAALRLALEHFRRAAELSPDSLTLAKAYAETFYVFQQPDWAQALAAWQKVLALSGENRDFANSHLARISLRLGRPAEADAYLASIHDPAFDGLKANLAKRRARETPTPTSPPP